MMRKLKTSSRHDNMAAQSETRYPSPERLPCHCRTCDGIDRGSVGAAQTCALIAWAGTSQARGRGPGNTERSSLLTRTRYLHLAPLLQHFSPY